MNVIEWPDLSAVLAFVCSQCMIFTTRICMKVLKNNKVVPTRYVFAYTSHFSFTARLIPNRLLVTSLAMYVVSWACPRSYNLPNPVWP